MNQFRLDIDDVGSLTVTRTGEVSDDLRRIYHYEVRDTQGELLTEGNDLRSGVSPDFNSHPGAREMTGSLISFLTCAPDSFNERTAAWARQHDDELALAALDLEWNEEDPL